MIDLDQLAQEDAAFNAQSAAAIQAEKQQRSQAAPGRGRSDRCRPGGTSARAEMALGPLVWVRLLFGNRSVR